MIVSPDAWESRLRPQLQVYDSLWVEGMWARVGPAAERDRAEAGVSQLYENYEALARGQSLSS